MTRSDNLTQRAYRTIRNDILACRHTPGDKLNIKAISVELGVSLGAVREAMSRLVSDGFVMVAERRGFRVTPTRIEDLTDLVRMRTYIEGECLRRSMEVGGLDWESDVVATCHRLSRTFLAYEGVEGELDGEYASAHASFHSALLSACDNVWLLQIRNWLFAQSERYRSLAARQDQEGRDLISEHEALAKAALKRDADLAVALLARHLEKTADILVHNWNLALTLPKDRNLRA